MDTTFLEGVLSALNAGPERMADAIDRLIHAPGIRRVVSPPQILESIIDALDKVIESREILKLRDRRMHQKAIKLLRDLVQDTGYFPRSIFITNLTIRRRDPEARGGNANVYIGDYEGSDVAVKIINRQWYTNPEERQKATKYIVSEALLWRPLNHPNVLKFLGIAEVGDPGSTLIALVLPWLRNRSIAEWRAVKGPVAAQLPLRITEIAHGLKYLHDESIVHGDLRTVNILVDDDGICKITDFGLSVLMSVTMTSSQAAAVEGYVAPELTAFSVSEQESISSIHPTKASDIFAFANVCYELYQGHAPFPGLKISSRRRIYRENILPDPPITGRTQIRLNRKNEDVESLSVPPNVWVLCTRCWRVDSSERPTTDEVAQELRGASNGL